jgi:hypothetical protein
MQNQAEHPATTVADFNVFAVDPTLVDVNIASCWLSLNRWTFKKNYIQ